MESLAPPARMQSLKVVGNTWWRGVRGMCVRGMVRERWGGGGGLDVGGFRFQCQALHVADVGDFNEVRGAESVFEHDVLRVDGGRHVQNLEHKM